MLNTNIEPRDGMGRQPAFVSPREKAGLTSTSCQWLNCCYSDGAQRYLQQWVGLLNASNNSINVYVKPPPENPNLASSGAKNTNLVVYEEPAQSWIKQALCGSPAGRLINQAAASVLIVRQPRWPVRHILFVTRGQRLDYLAITWLAPLTHVTQARVTVLAIQPFLSATNICALYGDGLPTWLHSDTPLGQQLRSIVQQCLQPRQVQLKFSTGDPRRQIQHAAASQQPDLIVLACEPPHWHERRLLGNLVDSLLAHADRPFLVAKNCVV